MLRALGHIRRMRGGAQSHLMRCSDGHYYVVKFQNNPQHTRILVNELLATRLAARLGLPTTPVAVVEVSPELIRLTPELCVELPRARVPCTPGLQFGSRYPGDPHKVTMLDFLPDEQQAAYWVLDASLTLANINKRHSIGVFGQNLTDRTVVSNTIIAPLSSFVVGELRPPRTVGIRVTSSF